MSEESNTDQIDIIVKQLKKRSADDKDSVVVLSGDVGDGKSTLATNVGFKMEPSFDFNRNMVWSRKELMRAINVLPKKSVVIPDEAIDLLYKREFANRDQISIIKLLNKCRKRNLTIIMNIPNFQDIDKGIRNDRVKYWIHVYKRGIGLLFARSPSFVRTDRWYLKEMSEVMEKQGVDGLKDIPTFKGIIKFDQLSKEIEAQYLAVAEEHASSTDEVDVFTRYDLDRAEQKGAVTMLTICRDNHLLVHGGLKQAVEVLGRKYKSVLSWMSDIREDLSIERRKTENSPALDNNIIISEKWKFGEVKPS